MSPWLIVGLIAVWIFICLLFVAVSVMAARGDAAEDDAAPRLRVAHATEGVREQGARAAYAPHEGQQASSQSGSPGS